MKKIIAIAVFSVAGILATTTASAQTAPRAQYQTVLYSVPPVAVMTVCYVNGVNYPVDFNNVIWGQNGFGVWFAIGRIVATPNGLIAVRSDGLQFAAVCQ
ncbi:MAG: hypothetical protein ABSD59_24555 [Terracidiphilus sp.]|jgi:hypothetical protein